MLQAFLNWLGFGLCHQLPERSFFGGGVQLPVCARDTGIYLGFCVSLAIIALLHHPDRPREFPTPAGWWAFALMVGSMAIDGGTEYAGLRPTTNDLRLITGLAAGFAIGLLLTPMLNDGIWCVSQEVRVLDSPSRLAVWVAALPVCYAAVWFGGPSLGAGFALFVAAAIFFTLTCVNLVMLCLTPWFERKATRLLDVWRPALIALMISAVEIYLAGMLRGGLVTLAARLS